MNIKILKKRHIKQEFFNLYNTVLTLDYIEEHKDELNFLEVLKNPSLSKEDKKYIKKKYYDELIMECISKRKNKIFHTIKSGWTFDIEQDMRALFDDSEQAKAIDIIGQQIADDIDKEILNNLMKDNSNDKKHVRQNKSKSKIK